MFTPVKCVSYGRGGGAAQEYLEQCTGGPETFEEMSAAMRDIVRVTAAACQGEVQNRRNTCELFGFDFCVDDNYKVWLIEVNCSPSLDPG